MKQCTHCGRKITDKADFCPYCGRRREDDRVLPDELLSCQTQKKKSRAPFYLVCISIILIISVITTGLFACRAGLFNVRTPVPEPTADILVTNIRETNICESPDPTAGSGDSQIGERKDIVSTGLQMDSEGKPYIRTGEDLDMLIEWMIDSCTLTVSLASLELSDDQLHKVAKTFDGVKIVGGSRTTASLTIELRPGLHIAAAAVNGKTDELSETDLDIYRKAQTIITELITADMTDYEKEVAIHDYIVDNCEYLHDQEKYSTHTVYGFFLYGKCQCAGYTDAFTLLGTLAGLRVTACCGDVMIDTSDPVFHAWNMVQLDGLWYVVDCTYDDRISGITGKAFLNVPNAQLSNDRTCRRLPKGRLAEAPDSNYPLIHDGYCAANAVDAAEILTAQLRSDGFASVLVDNSISSERIMDKLRSKASDLRVNAESVSCSQLVDVQVISVVLD